MRLNDEAPREEIVAPTFGALLDRYIEHELPERHSTRSSHLSNIRKHIRPRWGEQFVNKLKPMAMEQWLRDLPLAPKSKVHIRSLMHLVLKCAERWGVIEIGKNPVTLVRVKNASKRLKRPQILEVGQFFEMLKHLAEPYRTMVMVAQCTGLRISEILGLQWRDFNFEDHTFLVQRSSVGGRIDEAKTEYSKDYVPLDPRVEELLLRWRSFRVAELIGLPDGIGWHTFRHTYRSWLDETGAPMKVQQELMRHASIQTTMNVYGRAMTDSKRKANSQVVGLVFGETLVARKGNLNTKVLQ